MAQYSRSCRAWVCLPSRRSSASLCLRPLRLDHWEGTPLSVAFPAHPQGSSITPVPGVGVGRVTRLRAKVADSAALQPSLAPSDLGAVTCPTLVMAGDDDVVCLEHALTPSRGRGCASR